MIGFESITVVITCKLSIDSRLCELTYTQQGQLWIILPFCHIILQGFWFFFLDCTTSCDSLLHCMLCNLLINMIWPQAWHLNLMHSRVQLGNSVTELDWSKCWQWSWQATRGNVYDFQLPMSDMNAMTNNGNIHVTQLPKFFKSHYFMLCLWCQM